MIDVESTRPEFEKYIRSFDIADIDSKLSVDSGGDYICEWVYERWQGWKAAIEFANYYQQNKEK